MAKIGRLFSVLLALSIWHGAAGAQTAPAEHFFPAFATASERYAREVYLQFERTQPSMVDKQYERHRRNAVMAVSFTVDKNGQVQALKIARSSGDTALDEIVAGVIKGTRFPAPPPGASSDFVFPLRFSL